MTSPVLPPAATSSLLRRARFAASFRLLRAARALSSSARRLADLATSFASHALDPSDRSSLTAALYSSEPGTGRTTLYAWEDAWLSSDLPEPPARVLLGGAGRGREARWLLDRGYTVIAFDPARECVARHNASCPETQAVVLGYEALARASRARRDGPARSVSDGAALVLDRAPYDAALLGWGSFTHVLEERDQDALFEELALLVPHGPLLASFFMGRKPAASGRSAELGARLGEALGPAPHAYGNSSPNVLCLPHLGFAYSFDRTRLERLAQLSGRRLELYEAGYPHATFTAADQPSLS